MKVYGKACPLFVPLVEEGWIHDSVTKAVIERYLEPVKEEQVDTLILGCTHYPLLKDEVAEIMGDKVNLVNPAYETARELRELLYEKHLINDTEIKDGETEHRFYVSDAAEKFRVFASSILECGILSAEVINAETY